MAQRGVFIKKDDNVEKGVVVKEQNGGIAILRVNGADYNRIAEDICEAMVESIEDLVTENSFEGEGTDGLDLPFIKSPPLHPGPAKGGEKKRPWKK